MTAAFEPLRPGPLAGERRTRQMSAVLVPPRTNRLPSIDFLRGLVMVVMALDHTRDFFAAGGFNPRDVTDATLFLTRWITHFCAPTFIFLAGISAFLYGAQGRSTGDVSRFLLTRGAWLALIELTVVRFGLSFNIHLNHFVVQVIFAIGVSMMTLAVLVYLPRWMIAAVGLTMIGGHNVLDGINAAQLGTAAPLWNLLHQPGHLDIAQGVDVVVLYPLIPWIGVMATGYALGPVFMLEKTERVRALLALGASVTAGFFILRATNLYGDPGAWALQDSFLTSALSFINCEKYPPSLLYLMMTLGPVLLLLASFEGVRGVVAGWITTFGRVPLFYYVAHIYVLHAFALVYAWAAFGDPGLLIGQPHKPPGYGLGLAGIYAIWLAVVVSLYPLCRWFAGIKRRHNAWWLSYL